MHPHPYIRIATCTHIGGAAAHNGRACVDDRARVRRSVRMPVRPHTHAGALTHGREPVRACGACPPRRYAHKRRYAYRAVQDVYKTDVLHPWLYRQRASYSRTRSSTPNRQHPRTTTLVCMFETPPNTLVDVHVYHKSCITYILSMNLFIHRTYVQRARYTRGKRTRRRVHVQQPHMCAHAVVSVRIGDSYIPGDLFISIYYITFAIT